MTEEPVTSLVPLDYLSSTVAVYTGIVGKFTFTFTGLAVHI